MIGSTIIETATDVGYNLSQEMDAIWNSSTASINGVIAMYGEQFSSNQTSTYGVISGIKTSVDNMVSQLSTIAAQKVAEANNSSAVDTPQANAEPKVDKPITTTPSTTTQSGTTDVGEVISPSNAIDITEETPAQKTLTDDQMMGIAAAIWCLSDKGGWNDDPTRKNKLTEKFGSETAKKIQNLINQHSANGDLYSFWVKKNYNLDAYRYNAFKTGARNIDESQWAWTQEQGKEFIVRPSDGAILTPVAKGDSVLTAAASNNIWNMANNPSDFIRDNLNIGSANVPNDSNVQNNFEQHIDNVVFSMPNVKNYEQMLDSMKKDPNFDRLIEAMTLGKLAGKSSLAKGKAIR